jgi:hypothetical protein
MSTVAFLCTNNFFSCFDLVADAKSKLYGFDLTPFFVMQHYGISIDLLSLQIPVYSYQLFWQFLFDA